MVVEVAFLAASYYLMEIDRATGLQFSMMRHCSPLPQRMQLFETQEAESRTGLTEQAVQKTQMRVEAERIAVDSRWGCHNSDSGRRKAFLGSQHGSGKQI